VSLVEGLPGCGNGGVAKGGVVEVEDEAAVLDGAVLVHGIFGFDKGVRASVLCDDNLMRTALSVCL
jgi:hypothetical protein